jgi:hypothetical protein
VSDSTSSNMSMIMGIAMSKNNEHRHEHARWQRLLVPLNMIQPDSADRAPTSARHRHRPNPPAT